MSKRNTFILAGLLIVSAISIDVLEILGYGLLNQQYANFIPASLIGAGFSLLFLSLSNKKKKIE